MLVLTIRLTVYNIHVTHGIAIIKFITEMATVENPQEQEIKDVSTIEATSGENTPLIRNKRQRVSSKVWPKFHCRRQQCCLKSKAAILILFWNFILVVGFESFLDPNFFGYMVGELNTSSTILLSGSVYAALAFIYLLYPLAGCLADIRWGRYKTTINSLCFIFWGLISLLVAAGLAAATPFISSAVDSNLTTKESNDVGVTLFIILFCIVAALGGLLFFIWSNCI